MKPTAFLINTSRGPVVNEAALIAALENNHIAGAALDVYEREPQIPDGLRRPNVVLAPHLASASVETRTKMAMMAAENAIALFEGRRPPNILNPAALEGTAQREKIVMTLVTRNTPKLTLAGAQAVLAAAEKRATEIDVPMDIAVVDDGGHLLAFARMDGAKLSSVEIAIGKALSAALRRQPTRPGAHRRPGESGCLSGPGDRQPRQADADTRRRAADGSTASASAPSAPATAPKIRTSTSRKPAPSASKAPETRSGPAPAVGASAVSDLKHIARDIFRDTLAAIDIPRAMRQKLARAGSRITAGETTLDLAAYDPVRAVAIGKAAVAMARGLAELLAPDIPVNGILVAPHDIAIAATRIGGAGLSRDRRRASAARRRQPGRRARDSRSARRAPTRTL